MPAVVRLRSAVCLLGRFPALAGVDLDVAAGEIVLLSGANGAGKTTLLRLLAGLVPLYSGEATVLGHDLAHDRRGARRDLALVGHETFCYDDLTVRENLRFAARAAGRDAADGRRRARAGRPRRRRPTSCTDACRRASDAGSRSRWRWSRDPRLLLLDEPHAGLDADGRAVLDDDRRAPRRPRAARCCIASHELDRARALADREVVLTGGQAAARRGGRRRRCRRRAAADAGAAIGESSMNLWREVRLVAGKDLRIEARSRVTLAADRCRSG